MSDDIRAIVDNDEEEDLLVSQLNMDISNQYVVFTIGDEEYAIPILTVQEIISVPNLKKVPRSPEYIGGIINLRGKIIPLYLLRSRFAMELREIGRDSIVIIIRTDDDEMRTVGFVVDSVSDVISITDENLSEMPEWGGAVDNSYIEKIGRIGNRMIAVIDLSGFFTESESKALDMTRQMPG